MFHFKRHRQVPEQAPTPQPPSLPTGARPQAQPATGQTGPPPAPKGPALDTFEAPLWDEPSREIAVPAPGSPRGQPATRHIGQAEAATTGGSESMFQLVRYQLGKSKEVIPVEMRS